MTTTDAVTPGDHQTIRVGSSPTRGDDTRSSNVAGGKATYDPAPTVKYVTTNVLTGDAVPVTYPIIA